LDHADGAIGNRRNQAWLFPMLSAMILAPDNVWVPGVPKATEEK